MKKRLGEILIEERILNKEQLKEAVATHKKYNMKLGQFLVAHGKVEDVKIVESLCTQFKVERYQSDKHPIDKKLVSLISAETAQKYKVVPLKKIGSLLILAVTNPCDIEMLDAIEAMTDCEINVVMCTDQELNHLISNLYGPNTGIGSVLEDLQVQSYNEIQEKEAEMDLEVTSLKSQAEDAPVVRIVNEILSQAIREGASDVHISPEKESVQVRFRVDGKLHSVPSPPKNLILPIISRLKILSNMDISVLRRSQDGRFTIKMEHREINVRTSTIPTIYGENMVLRLLDTSSGIYSLEKLGMTLTDREKIGMLLEKPYGMMLSTGPTGSGKTTTLYSILQKLNRPDINIITLEDPVEYRIDNIRQTQLNRKARMDFASGIRSILRQDPDVIMVGEIRDAETAKIAVQAALTGHRVLSTLHTNDAAGAISRFIDMGIAPFLISSVLLVLIAQRLVRKVCTFCREEFVPSDALMSYWGLEHSEENHFYQAKGCFNCLNTGYKGRTGVFEVLVIDETIQEMIMNNSSSRAISQTAQTSGKLVSLKKNAVEKVRLGITTFEEAATVVMG